MKVKIDWKEMGKFISLIVNIYTSFAKVLKGLNIEPGELMEWIEGPGKDFTSKKVYEIGREYIRLTRPLRLSSWGVDLYATDHDPKHNRFGKSPYPYEIFSIERKPSSTRIQLWYDGVRIDANDGGQVGRTRKVLLRNYQEGFISENFEGFVNHLFLEFLKLNREFIPEDWHPKSVENVSVLVCFLGTKYTSKEESDSLTYVQYMKYENGVGWKFGFISLEEIKRQSSIIVVPCFDKYITEPFYDLNG